MKKGFKKIIAAVVVIGAFAIYFVTQRAATQPTTVATNGTSTDGTNASGDTSNSASHETTNPNLGNTGATDQTQTNPTTPGAFADGKYTGSVADAYFGSLQVQAVITGGKISDVIFLQYPNDRATTIMINQSAMPKLKSEAIAAQKAQVSVISGATQTSEAFVQTLQSALDKAKA